MWQTMQQLHDDSSNRSKVQSSTRSSAAMSCLPSDKLHSMMAFVTFYCCCFYLRSSIPTAAASFSNVGDAQNRQLWIPAQQQMSSKCIGASSLFSLGPRQVAAGLVNGARHDVVMGSESVSETKTTTKASDSVLFSKNVLRDNLKNFCDIDNTNKNELINLFNVTNPVCRIVALSDGKLQKQDTSFACLRPPTMLDKLDAIFHAKAHDDTRRLQYMQRSSSAAATSDEADSDNNSVEKIVSRTAIAEEEQEDDEQQLVVTVRRSLEDAGFELLSKRDYDLCEALNAGYLLRLSILPDISQADPGIAREFYPERFQSNGTVSGLENNNENTDDEMLFEGRILVFWRGYSCEVTRGRLLLPKLDYLQANLVQRSAAYIVKTIGQVERLVLIKIRQVARFMQRSIRQWFADAVATIPVGGRLAKIAQTMTTMTWDEDDATAQPPLHTAERESRRFFRLGRYGGSKIRFVGSPNPKDALNPFLICEIPAADVSTSPPCPNAHNDYLHRIETSPPPSRTAGLNGGTDLYKNTLKHDEFTCLYDEQSKDPPRATQLLERVSIGDVVDSFTHVGRARLLASFFAKSELVEPSFDEVFVLWRPMPESPKPNQRRLVLPKVVYDVADIFDIEGLPPRLPEPAKPLQLPLEIRAFHQVPMANLLAVLPKTKLVLRPADAFVFDLVSLVSFLLIIGSQRFDSPKLDLLALVSVTFWTIRTFFRYRNKLTSYDLLVKTFLTSKISHRNAGALKYVATEAGSQRAIRAALVYTWLVRRMATLRSTFVGNKPIDLKVVRTQLERGGEIGVNELLQANDKVVRVDMNAALNDLEELQLATFSDDKTVLTKLVEPNEAVDVLRETWTGLF